MLVSRRLTCIDAVAFDFVVEFQVSLGISTISGILLRKIPLMVFSYIVTKLMSMCCSKLQQLNWVLKIGSCCQFSICCCCCCASLILWFVVCFRSWITWTIMTICSVNQTARHYLWNIHAWLKQMRADRIYALVKVRYRQLCFVLIKCYTQSRSLPVNLQSSLELPR